MMLFRKKPVEIEATQWFKIGDHPSVMDYHKAYDLGYRNDDILKTDILTIKGGKKGLIKTLEGWHEVTPGDWIITGVKGEVYPCKPDIFEATYDAVT